MVNYVRLYKFLYCDLTDIVDVDITSNEGRIGAQQRYVSAPSRGATRAKGELDMVLVLTTLTGDV